MVTEKGTVLTEFYVQFPAICLLVDVIAVLCDYTHSYATYCYVIMTQFGEAVMLTVGVLTKTEQRMQTSSRQQS